jgi:hypothetical protein
MKLFTLNVLLILCLSYVNSRSLNKKISQKDVGKSEKQSASTVALQKDSFVTKSF